MIPERYLNFLSEISGKFPIGNFGKLPRPIPSHKACRLSFTIGTSRNGKWEDRF